MNKKEQVLKEKKNWMRYHIPGMGNLNRVKKNAIFISTANGYEHELAKFNICWGLKSIGHNFLTEAEISIDGKKYRRDVVDLTTGEVKELETDPQRAKRFKDDPQKEEITVIELWRDKNGS